MLRLWARSRQKLESARRQEVELRPDGDNARRVERRVALIIVPLDMREIDGRSDARVLVELAGIISEVRVVDEPPHIAFEMPYIDGIKAHERCEQPPIRFSQALAAELSLGSEPAFEPGEALK